VAKSGESIRGELEQKQKPMSVRKENKSHPPQKTKSSPLKIDHPGKGDSYWKQSFLGAMF